MARSAHSPGTVVLISAAAGPDNATRTDSARSVLTSSRPLARRPLMPGELRWRPCTLGSARLRAPISFFRLDDTLMPRSRLCRNAHIERRLRRVQPRARDARELNLSRVDLRRGPQQCSTWRNLAALNSSQRPTARKFPRLHLHECRLEPRRRCVHYCSDAPRDAGVISSNFAVARVPPAASSGPRSSARPGTQSPNRDCPPN
jgi:hypothetical protein